MDKGLYVAMTGARQNMQALAIHANNLANVSTHGFKADLEQARAMPVIGEGLPSRVYAMTERPATDFSPGPLVETGRDLDIALRGQGFIAVQSAAGDEAYTRLGSLQIDAAGQLRTGSGLPVLGDGGPIFLPPYEKVDIGDDGTITVKPLGSLPTELAVVDKIKLVNPDLSQLQKSLDGLMRAPEGGSLAADLTVRVDRGFLEGSNVNAVTALTEMISLSRQFEMQVKMMSTVEENAAASARILRSS